MKRVASSRLPERPAISTMCRTSALRTLTATYRPTRSWRFVPAAKASRAPLQLLPGLVLHDQGGRATAAADAILRAGEALPLAQI